MDDDNIVPFGQLGKTKENPGQSKHRENHFYMNTFLNFDDAEKFVQESMEQHDMEEFFVGMLEIRNVNHKYQAGVSIFRKQGELFDV